MSKRSTSVRAELQQAYWFIRHNFPPMAMAGIYRLTPFPGTKFWQEAVDMGIVSNDLEDWRPFNYLDQDKRDFLFFNKHYSLDTFKQAYTHFARITDRNHLAVNTEQQELALKSQIDPLYQRTLKALKPARVLELSGFTRMLAEWVAEEEGLDAEVELLRPWEFDDFSPSAGFDLILVNLALEQMVQPVTNTLTQLQDWLAPGGQMLLICYHPLHGSLLYQLLKGQWNSDFWGMRPFDLIRFQSLDQLSQMLRPLGVAEEGRLSFPGRTLGIPAEVLELLKQIPGASLAGLDDIAYTVLTTPKETQDGKHLQAAGESGASRNFALRPA
ncbi:MAG: hypothetical protein CVV27_21555 [Candidatus Melainabacteria bacterium HGW-Melainabacteria-1]|nr:MAG: hypothetical protein CVV27_21555 [Candidatus Melainabacteria bacterium HGW-Melainabacteria-1]